jgi:hypothetical protein
MIVFVCDDCGRKETAPGYPLPRDWYAEIPHRHYCPLCKMKRLAPQSLIEPEPRT